MALSGAHQAPDETADLPAERLARRLARLPRETLIAELEAVYACSPVGMVLFDRDLVYVRLNAALAEMNGLSVEEHIGRTPFDVVPDLMRSAFDPFMRVFETGEPLRDIEVRGETPRLPGVARVWRENAFPIKRPDGSVEFILVTVDELTELERAERRADAAESRFELALRSRSIGTFEHGEAWDDISWSAAVHEMHGLPPSQKVPLAEALARIPQEDVARLDDVRRRTLAGEVLPPTEYRFRMPDGTTRWFSVVGQPIDTPRGRRVIGIYEDVTERVLARQALQESDARKAHLLRLSDALRPLSEAGEILDTAARLLADEIGADRVFYAEIEAAGAACRVDREFRRRAEAPSAIGRYELVGIPTFADAALAGRMLMEDDVAASGRLTGSEKAFLRPFGIAAYVHLPMSRKGSVQSQFVVTGDRPRAWTATELRLIEETAERTWAATERARAEAAMHRSERRFRTLAQALPGLVWHSDPKGNTLFVNQTYLDFSGRPAEFFAGRGWVQLLHPEDAQAQGASYLDASRARRAWHGRMRIRRHDGMWRWVDAYAEPFIDDEGAHQGQLGVALDVTDAVEAEAALRDSEARFRVLVERIGQAFYVADLAANRALYLSPAFEEIWGRPSTPLFDDLSALIDTVHPDDRDGMRVHVETTMAGRASTHSYRIVRPDGAVRWIDDHSFPVDGAEGRRAAGLAMDVTDRKAQALALEDAVAKKDLLMREVQHRVKNNLTLVNSLLEMQAAGTTDLVVREALVSAAGRVRTIARMHDKLHRLGDHSEVDLGATLFEVAQGVAENAGHPAHVRLRCETESLLVSGDVVLPVSLIVNELLTNAYKYAFPKGRTGTVKLVVERLDCTVRIIVSDDGIGLPSGQPPKAGLGTRVVRGLASQVRGTLQRAPGAGCAYVLEFPMERAPRPE
jgi:PAS domain S-box-containing protein